MPFDSFVAHVEGAHATRRAALVVHRSLPSTNDLGRRILGEYLRDGREVPSTDLVAWHQAGGRGRHDRVWSSPAGGGVWVSMVRSLASPAQLQRLPLAVGVALLRALSPWVGEGIRLKWPNDLVMDGKKMGGILVEGRSIGDHAAAILGFGINYAADLDAFDAPNATSIAASLKDPPALADVVVACIDAVEATLIAPPEEVLDAYRDALVHPQGAAIACRMDESMVEGRFVGVDDDGLLVLETESGRRTLAAAEIVERPLADDS